FAFTAAVVGGIGSLPGAMLGGLLIGIAESFITGYISSTYTNLLVFGLLIVVMLVRPSGLLGRAQLHKVWRRHEPGIAGRPAGRGRRVGRQGARQARVPAGVARGGATGRRADRLVAEARRRRAGRAVAAGARPRPFPAAGGDRRAGDRAARGWAEHRRRLGRDTRPRIRRLLPLRRLPLRPAVIRPKRPPWA